MRATTVSVTPNSLSTFNPLRSTPLSSHLVSLILSLSRRSLVLSLSCCFSSCLSHIVSLMLCLSYCFSRVVSLTPCSVRINDRPSTLAEPPSSTSSRASIASSPSPPSSPSPSSSLLSTPTPSITNPIEREKGREREKDKGMERQSEREG